MREKKKKKKKTPKEGGKQIHWARAEQPLLFEVCSQRERTGKEEEHQNNAITHASK